MLGRDLLWKAKAEGGVNPNDDLEEGGHPHWLHASSAISRFCMVVVHARSRACVHACVRACV